MNENINVFLAFTAGLLSFFSPCVLPLIPSYLCVIGGIQFGDLSGENKRNKPWLVLKTLFFTLGFSIVFIVLSIILAASFALMGSALNWISWISGTLVIILGINIIFNFLPFLNYEKRIKISQKNKQKEGFNQLQSPHDSEQAKAAGIKAILGGGGSAFIAGAAFGAGWTPCIGPVLTGILMLASQAGGIPQAIIYLVFFSIGLGLPFILASAFFDIFIKTKGLFQKHLRLIQIISGIILILMGIIIISGHYRIFSSIISAW